jgi:8-oxo-dGTP diphosphatase
MNNREYPERPIVGVGGVVIQDGRVVLVRRGGPPLEGNWSIPGGTLEVGETIAEGVQRELREETGLEVRVGELIEVFERIFPGESKPGDRAAARGAPDAGERGESGRAGSAPGNAGASEAGRPQYHFVILDYLCEALGGALRAGGDAADVAFVREDELAPYSLSPTATRVICKAFALSRARATNT